MGVFVDYLTYEAELPAVPSEISSDVVTQRFSVHVTTEGGEAGQVVDLSRFAATATFEVPQDSNVQLELRYLDDAGNQSGPVYSQPFVAKDTIAPSAPGDFGAIKVVSERRVEVEPVPAPVPDPVPEVPAEPAPEVPAEPAPEVPAEPAPEVPADPAPEASEAPETPAEPVLAPETPVEPEAPVEAPEAPAEVPAEEGQDGETPVVDPAPVEDTPAEVPATEVPATDEDGTSAEPSAE